MAKVKLDKVIAFARSLLARIHETAEDPTPAGASFSLRTRSRVDVGSWFRKKPVWACILKDSLLLMATGKKPYQESIPLCELRESLYNHVTGEIVLAPFEGDKVSGLRMSPLDAARFLKLINT
jgi:hypothetical protein